jgi:Transposase zinc-binding domain
VGTAAHVTALHYEQRRPETTPLYGLIATHLETFLAEARAAHDRGVPRYVERELRAYLACGIHAHGFLRARCSTCHKEILVAFSCKLRGVCPSCNARRMCSTAAHLTDRVFPGVPVRQWVLSVPFELRLLLARNAAARDDPGSVFGATLRPHRHG